MPVRRRVMVVSMMLSGGGAERFTSTLLNHLDRAHFAPELCLVYPQVTYPLAPDVPVHHLGHKGLPWMFRSIRRLRRVLAETRPDVVLSSLAYTSIFVGEALRGCQAAPRWLARVGAPPEVENRGGPLKFVFARWQRRVYPRAAGIFPNAHGVAREFVRYFPFAVNKVRVLPNPTDFDAIDRQAEETPEHVAEGKGPLLLSVGRLGPEKRPDLLLAAFDRVRRQVPARLWICGDGPLRSQVERDIVTRGLADCVKILGFCKNPYALMRRADLFVMTSDYEGLPNALIEAQGLGLPAVSTRCPHGPEEIIEHGTTGLLTRPGDAGELTTAILDLLQQPDRRLTMGKAARELARERFNLTTLVRRWEEVLAEEGGVESCAG